METERQVLTKPFLFDHVVEYELLALQFSSVYSSLRVTN